jgi:hypothetical protein
MPEIGTSGSMSENGKRSVAKWPKLPRPFSTLPRDIVISERGNTLAGARASHGLRMTITITAKLLTGRV